MVAHFNSVHTLFVSVTSMYPHNNKRRKGSIPLTIMIKIDINNLQ